MVNALAPTAQQIVTEAPPERIVSSTVTVMTWMISDPFCLEDQETMWVAHHLKVILAPIAGVRPKYIDNSVKDEIVNGTYSDRLLLEGGVKTKPTVADRRVLTASTNDWVTAICGILEGYDLRPLIRAGIEGQITGLLKELGVGDSQNPRGSRYLPNSVRYVMAQGR